MYHLNCEPVKGTDFYTGYYTDVYPYKQWIETNSALMQAPKFALILATAIMIAIHAGF